jgi:hypothetical protein
VPFTISHAAAVLPLRRLTKGALPLAALMIGSMSPDFAYFVPGDATDRVETHSFAGLFWFCWPVSIALWLVFVRVLEQPTLALLPSNWRTRFAASNREMTFHTLALASVAVILGATTHLIWDGFTHRGTATVHALPALHGVVFHYGRWPIRWFVVLQHLSTLFGLLVLAIWAWRQPPGVHPHPALPEVSAAMRRRAVGVLFAASFALAIGSFIYHADTWFGRRLFHLAIGGMSGWAVAWFAVALVIKRNSHRPLR